MRKRGGGRKYQMEEEEIVKKEGERNRGRGKRVGEKKKGNRDIKRRNERNSGRGVGKRE